MPRPPILPTLDWQSIFNQGLDYASWLKAGEHPENQAKMEEARKAQPLPPQWEAYMKALPRPVHVIAIAEDWCGDVVRHVPVLQRLADAGPNLKVRYISREQSPDTFARFLTNGGEAIPKFVFLSDRWVECGNWGPMPDACRELIARGKASGDGGGARQKVSALYEADPDKRMVLSELLRLIEIASADRP